MDENNHSEINDKPLDFDVDEDLEKLDLDSELNSNNDTVVLQDIEPIRREALAKKIISTLSRQDYCKGLASIDRNFFTDLKEYLKMDKAKSVEEQEYDRKHGVGKNFWVQVTSFVNHRTERIISHALSFSPTIYEKLSEEERRFYKRLCGNVQTFREEIQAHIADLK